METLHWHLILSSSWKSKRKMRWVWHNSSSMQHPRPFEKITFSVLLLQNTIQETSTANTHTHTAFFVSGSEYNQHWVPGQMSLNKTPIFIGSGSNRQCIGSTSGLTREFRFRFHFRFWDFCPNQLTQSGKTYVNKILLCNLNYQVQLQLPTELWRDWRTVSLRAFSRAQK